jgi:hypothetical protein
LKFPIRMLCFRPVLSDALAPGPVRGATCDSPEGDADDYCEARANRATPVREI